MDRLIQRLEKTFGTLAKQEKEFVNTGIAHRQTDEGDTHIYILIGYGPSAAPACPETPGGRV